MTRINLLDRTRPKRMGRPQLFTQEERRQKVRLRAQRWRQENPDKVKAQRAKIASETYRWYQLKSHYGVTELQYDGFYVAQSGKCRGCQLQLGYPLGCLDHDHTTGKPRGLLCACCNWALGHAKDNPATLRNLADYLESH